MLFIYVDRGELSLKLHREQQTQERMKLAKHRQKSKEQGNKYIHITIDGMDQKKTRLPHWPRPPKNVDESSLIQLHLVGCLVTCVQKQAMVFLNYPTLHNDGNLTITIIQHVLKEWDGRLPSILYLQLDNTARENKNNLLLAYLNMLVRKRIFKKIKLGFLIVGHTHDTIDQMFSKFSKKLNRVKCFSLPVLERELKSAYTPTPVITLLIETFDFRRYVFESPSILIDSVKNISYHHQFKIEFTNDDDMVPTMWRKKLSSDLTWQPEEGVKMLKDELPQKNMYSSSKMPLRRKGEGKQDGNSKKSHVGDIPKFSLEEMTAFLEEISKNILGVKNLFEDSDVKWWEDFFKEQLDTLPESLEPNKEPRSPWIWSEPYLNISTTMTSLPEDNPILQAEIQERIVGPTPEIYCGPYKNVRAAERKRQEKFLGDYKDLEIGTFICTAAKEDPFGRLFWIGKVEKIIKSSDEGVPLVISILWHSVEKSTDDIRLGKYFPATRELNDQEIAQSSRRKGKSKVSNKLHREDLDIAQTEVFCYNFDLTKARRLKAVTIAIINKRLEEYDPEEEDNSQDSSSSDDV